MASQLPKLNVTGLDSDHPLHSLVGLLQDLGTSPRVFAWSPEGDAVYVRRLRTVPLQLERVDLETGARTKHIEIGPRPPAGLVWMSIDPVADHRFDPALRCAYDYCRQLSRLFLVQ